MSWSDKEIDKLFKESANTPVVKYKEAYWKEMEAMLPAKKGGDMIWMLTSLIFVGLFTTIFFVHPIVLGDTEQLLASRSSSDEEINVVVNGLDSGNKLIRESNITPQDLPPTRRGQEQLSVEDLNRTLYSVSHDNPLNRSGLVTSEESSSIVKVNHSAQPESVNSALNMEVSTTSVVIGHPVEVTNVALSENQKNDIVANKEWINLSGTISQKKKHETIEQGNITDQVGVLSTNPLVTILTEGEKQLMDVVDNLKMPVRTQVYVQALGGVSQSLITPSLKLSHSWGLGAGIVFGKGRFLFTTGVNGIWSNHNDLLLTREAKVYGFGSELIRHDLKYENLFLLEADLSIGYKIGKSTVKLGVRPSYIVSTKVSYERSVSGVSDVKEKFYGYTDGFNRFGIKPTLGYSYDLRSGFSVGLNLGTQLTPLIKGDFINGQNSQLPIDGQLYLRKTIKLRK